MPSKDPYRPCEFAPCGAIDSTHCEFRIGWDGQVVPSQREKAKQAGCRVVRFLDDQEKEE